MCHMSRKGKEEGNQVGKEEVHCRDGEGKTKRREGKGSEAYGEREREL